ncbi:MAG: tetratricopeptide repeat protein [Spirochaetaceae bacterium]
MKKSAGILSLTALTLLLGACSSSPDPPEAVFETKNQASRYAEFGNAYFADAEYELALRFFELALEENTSVDNQPGIATNHNAIGRVYLAVGRLAPAESNFRLALEIAQRHEAPEALVQAHANLGELYLYQDRTADAAAALGEAEAIIIAEELGADPIVLHNLAVVRMREGSLEEAQELLGEAAAINEERSAWAELASNQYMLASLERRRDNLPGAIERAELALDYDKRAENSPGIAKDLHILGRLNREAGNSEAAYDYLQRSLRVTIALNQFEETRRNLRILTEVAEEAGDREAAQEYRRQLELLDEQETEFLGAP